MGGHVRSGTTWVYDLLTSHELVAGAFETWVFSPEFGVGGLFAPAQWDRNLAERMTEATGRPFGLGQFASRAEVAADVRQLLEGWWERVLEPRQRFLVEKTPPHLLAMPMISEVFPHARFIHVIRDGRDVAVSLRAAARGWNRGFAAMDGRLYRKQARTWARQVMRITRDGAALGDKYLEVRYEDIQRSPNAELARMFDFAGIPHDDSAVDRIVAANTFSRRFDQRQDSFRRKGEVGDWRNHFGPVSGAAFSRIAGEVLVQKGYEAGRHWWLSPALMLRALSRRWRGGSEN